MNQKELLDQIHIIVHSIRLIPNYKASVAEMKIGKMIREYYIECPECKEISENIKLHPVQKNSGMLERFKSVMKED